MTQTGQRKTVALAFVALGGILLLAAGLWVAFSLPPQALPSSSPSAPPPTIAAEFPSAPPPAGHEEPPRVSLEEAKAAFDAGSAVFVDTRSSESYAASHIPGAVSIPFGETEARMQELDPARWIITYCS
jgi:hypothetical protein